MEFSDEAIKKLQEEKLKAGEKKYGKMFKDAVMEIIALEKMLTPAEVSSNNVIPLSQWNKYYAYPTVGALRQLYYYRHTNGFSYCVEYGGLNGKTILINAAKYFIWQKNRKSCLA